MQHNFKTSPRVNMGRRNSSNPLTMAVLLAVVIILAGINQAVAQTPKDLNGNNISVTPDNTALPNPLPANYRFVAPAPAGDDGNNGSAGSPWLTLKHAVARKDAGDTIDTIVLAAGDYRESVTVSKKLTIRSAPMAQVWLKGSEVVPSSGWTASGAVYSRTWTGLTVRASDQPGCTKFQKKTGLPDCLDEDHQIADRLDMFFVNGVRLEQVDALSEVRAATASQPATFYINYSTNKVYLGVNPAGKIVEGTTLKEGLKLSRSAVGSEIRGIGFAHYAVTAVESTADDMRFVGNTSVWNGFQGLDINSGGGARAQVLDNRFSYNGLVGLQGFGSQDMLIEGNIFTFNNIEHFRTNWSAAGMKIAYTINPMVRNNTVTDNYANGIWFDIGTEGAIVVRNDVRRNEGLGIYYEISHDAIIASNLVVGNNNGIQANSSNEVKIWNNTLVDNKSNIVLVDDGRVNHSQEGGNKQELACSQLRRLNDFESRNIVVKNNVSSRSANGNSLLTVDHGGCTGKNPSANPPIDNTTSCPIPGSNPLRYETLSPCNNTESMIDPGGVDYNSYYHADSNINLAKWKPVNEVNKVKVNSVSYKALTGTNGFRTNTTMEDNGAEYSGATNPFFTSENSNPVTGTFTLKPGVAELNNGLVLPADIASAIGVAPGLKKRGILTSVGATQPPPGPVNTPPTVAITAPANNTSIVFGQSVTLTAAAADVNGTVSKVEFFDGGELIRTDDEAPYSSSWTPETARARIVTAVATDNGGASTTSAPINLTVTKATPTVSVTGGSFAYNGLSHPASGLVTGVDGASLGAPSITYNGLTTVPVAIGSYAVVATFAGNSDYNAASATATLLITAPGQAPFGGTPRPIPGRVEAEDFDTGGEAVAYHDLVAGNQGDSNYRPETSVDVKETVDGGADQKRIGYFQAGEYLEYTVNVAQGGRYDLNARVSAAAAGRELQVSLDGVVLGTLNVPNTGSYDEFQTVTLRNLELPAGVQVLRVEMPLSSPDYFDLNWVEIIPTVQTLAPVADAYVRAGTYAGQNFGAANELLVKNNDLVDFKRESYLRFDTTSVEGATAVSSARLRLYGNLNSTDLSNITTEVFGATNTTWSESALTWNTRPASRATPLAETTVTNTTPRWYEWDVTDYVNQERAAGRKLVTLVLKNPVTTSPVTVFRSSEATGNRPQLVIAK